MQTTSFYPNSQSALIYRFATHSSFSSIRTGGGTNINKNSPGGTAPWLWASSAGWTNLYDALMRFEIFFDTSAIGVFDPGAKIDSATLYIAAAGDSSAGLGTSALHLCSSGGDPTNSAASDFQNMGTTSYGSIAYNDFKTDGTYSAIVLNADGKNAINRNGYTSIGVKFAWDLLNDTTGLTWSGGAESYYYPAFVALANKPYLEVSYSKPVIMALPVFF